MLKQMAWNTFKNTGNINTFMELIEIENTKRIWKVINMGILKTKGIIIAESNMNDFDKMLTILTPNGKIGCAAKGARRPKSMLMAATQFCVLENTCYTVIQKLQYEFLRDNRTFL